MAQRAYFGLNFIPSLIIAILPVFLICLYTYKKDKGKEPIRLLIKLFLSGILSCFMVLLISAILEKIFPFLFMGKGAGFIGLLLQTFIGIALVEEGCKFIMSYINGYKSVEFDELYDIILYCIVVSCGFAAFENILYIFTSDYAFTVGIMRGFLAVPGHASDALFMGYYLSLAKLASLKGNKQLEKKNMMLSILIPTILHGVYDFCTLSEVPALMIVFIVFVIVMYALSIKKLRYVAKNNINLFPNNTQVNNFCTKCGNFVDGNFCSNCGSKQN